MRKLAIISSHPIQYYAPVFSLQCRRGLINIKVFYSLGENAAGRPDPGFAKHISWDIPLLKGYDFEWLENVSAAPGAHHFKGINTPYGVNQIEKYQPDAVLVFGWAYESHLQ